MAHFLSNIKYAELIGITKQGVGVAIKGKLIFRSKLGIDPEHPINILYRQRIEKKRKRIAKTSKGALKVAAKKKAAVAKPTENYEPRVPEPVGYDIDDRKKIEETRLKKIQADKAALEYATTLSIMVDDKTLRRKLGVFNDFLQNDLISFPDSIADFLVNEARSATDATQAIALVTDTLKKSIKDILVKAKKAAREIRPPNNGRKYVVRKAER